MAPKRGRNPRQKTAKGKASGTLDAHMKPGPFPFADEPGDAHKSPERLPPAQEPLQVDTPVEEAQPSQSEQPFLTALEEQGGGAGPEELCGIQPPETCLKADVTEAEGEAELTVQCVGCSRRRVHPSCGIQVSNRMGVVQDLATGRCCSEDCFIQYLKFTRDGEHGDAKLAESAATYLAMAVPGDAEGGSLAAQQTSPEAVIGSSAVEVAVGAGVGGQTEPLFAQEAAAGPGEQLPIPVLPPLPGGPPAPKRQKVAEVGEHTAPKGSGRTGRKRKAGGSEVEGGGGKEADIVEDDPLLGYNFESCLRVTPNETHASAPMDLDHTRLAYGGLRRHVRMVHGKTLTSRARDVQGYFLKLLEGAAVYTSRADPRLYNRRPPIQLQARAFLEGHVRTFMANFKAANLQPAFLVIDNEGTEEEKFVAKNAFECWCGGDPEPALDLVEYIPEEEPPEHERRQMARVFTLVGNHSTEAQVRLLRAKRPVQPYREAYVFFRSQLGDDHFRLLASTENVLASEDAKLVGDYDDYMSPSNMIPFLRDLWKSFGSPARQPSAQKKPPRVETPLTEKERWWEFQRLLQNVLESPADASVQAERVAQNEARKMEMLEAECIKKIEQAVQKGLTGADLEKAVQEAETHKSHQLRQYKTKREAKLSGRGFQAEINIAIMSQRVFNNWVELLGKLESERPVVGLGNVASHDRVVRRFYLKNVSAFPECYYRQFFWAVLADEAPQLVELVGALKHAAGRKGGRSPPWSSPSISDWFVCMRLHADWIARFTTYHTLWKTLATTLPTPTTGDKRGAIAKWREDFQKVAGWKPDITDPYMAHSDRHCRPFVTALLPSQKEPLSLKVRKAQEVAGGRTYEEFTANLVRGYDWFPPFLQPKNAMVSGTKDVSFNAYADTTFQKILTAHERACSTKEQLASGRAELLTSRLRDSAAILSREALVLVRPLPVDNLILTGAGTSLHAMSTDEADYLRPFLYTARLWLQRMPHLLYGSPELLLYLQENVVRPLFELAYMVVTADPRQEVSPKRIQRALEEEVAFTTLHSGAQLAVKDICDVLMAFHALRSRNWRWDIYNAPRQHTRDAEPRSRAPPPYIPCSADLRTPLSDNASSDDGEEAEETAGKVPKVGKRLRYRQPTEDQEMLVDKDNVKATRPVAYDTFEGFLMKPEFSEQFALEHRHMATRFVPWPPLQVARWVLPRLGLDQWVGVGPDLNINAKNLRAVLVEGDAKEAAPYNAAGRWRGVELVLIDPPFGLGKHGDVGDLWDEPECRWKGVDVRLVLERLVGAEMLPPSTGREPSARHFNVAVYTTHEGLEEIRQAIEAWAETARYPVKGHFVVILGRDGPAYLRKGTKTPGHAVPLLVVKLNHGTSGVMFDDCGGGLGGRMQYFFPRPESVSKYGRYEIDALLKGDKGEAVNKTQKSIEESRLLVRLLTPDAGPVVSVCNGTGTAMVASLLEGRDCLGVESDRVQNQVARRRLQTFFQREELLCQAREAGLDSSAACALRLAASQDALIDDERTPMDTARLPPKLEEFLHDERSLQIVTMYYGGAYAKLAPLYARSLKRDEAEALQESDTPVVAWLFTEPKRFLRTIAEAGVASLKEVKEILEWCRRNRDKANDTPEKEDELESALWRSCRDKVDGHEKEEWLRTLPKRLGESVEADGAGPIEAGGDAATHSPDKVAGPTTSRVEHVVEEVAEGSTPLEAGDVFGGSEGTDGNESEMEFQEL